MLRRALRLAGTAALAAVLTTACKEATGSNLTEYKLTSIAGLALPTAYAPNPNQDARMMSAYMVLYEGGRGTWYGISEHTLNGTQYDWTQEFNWVQTGFDISITQIHPSPYGSSFRRSGESARSAFASTIVPETGA